MVGWMGKILGELCPGAAACNPCPPLTILPIPFSLCSLVELAKVGGELCPGAALRHPCPPLASPNFSFPSYCRSLVELAKVVGELCPGAALCAHKELTVRLTRMVVRDERGRITVAQVSCRVSSGGTRAHCSGAAAVLC